MARHASTYRQARRAAWKEQKPVDFDGMPMDWFDFNYALKDQAKKQGYGSVATIRDWYVPKPNKYIPHIGAKQRAKGAK